MREFHGCGLGHFDKDKTFTIVGDHYLWPKVYKDVNYFDKRCPAY
uniref:Integrase zinc-binding domain-containing protein n=1 Tax=Rhizophora mucronata TaxID=61149 RepID=A0A2P2P007_RHIMU